MCKNLEVTQNALMLKKNRLKLGAFLESGEYITWRQLLIAIGLDGAGYAYKELSWGKNRNFPIKYKKINKSRFKVVYLEDFWKWAEQNRELIDFSLIEENILGEEPQWVKQQRKLDYQAHNLFITTPWTATEDRKLMMLLKEFKYTYSDLSKKMHRKYNAISKRIFDLKVKERPVKADNHNKWTDEEYAELLNLIKQGAKYILLSEQLVKSEKAIRGKIFRHFNTENLDKVREKLKEESNDSCS